MRAETRKAIAAGGPRRPGRRFSAEARAVLARFASEQIAAGRPVAAVTRELELSIATLGGFTRARPSFVPVEVTPEARSSITVRGPHGLVIEGLDVGAVAELLRRLA